MNTKAQIKYLFLIFVIFIAACIETDIYLPAFPDMMTWFSASEAQIQDLLTWNFIGICLAGPFYGPISDSFGRKIPLVISLAIFLLGSLITLFAANLDQMLWGRVLQGLGSGGCFTLGTAIVFDAFQKDDAIKAFNNLNTFVPIIMSMAPLIGGYLNHGFGFRSNFLVIALFVALSLLICLFMFKETLPKEKRTIFKAKSILRDFKEALSSVPFWQITIVMSIIFAGYISFLSGTSVLFVLEFGMNKIMFPIIQAAILGGWVAGSLLLNRFMNKWGHQRVKKIGIATSISGGVILALTTLLTPQNPYLLTCGIVVYAFGANWIVGLYFPEGMELLPHIKGITASLLTSVRLLISSLVIALASSLYNGTIYPYSLIVLASIAIMMPILFLYERNKLTATSSSNC